MTANVYVGLAVTAHNNTTTCTTVFDNVTLVAAASNTPPTAAITTPADGAVVKNPTNVVIEAQASDSDGNVTQVAFFDGSTPLGMLTSPPYTFTWSNPAAGGHSLTARATDDDGAATTSAPVNVTIEYNSGCLLRGFSRTSGRWVLRAARATVAGRLRSRVPGQTSGVSPTSSISSTRRSPATARSRLGSSASRRRTTMPRSAS